MPEFSFNPVKWADAYELQKRTGYVFCPREVVQIVGLASKVVFLGIFGVTMAKEADGYIKAVQAIEPAWLNALVHERVIDQITADHLSTKRYSLIAVRAENLRLPDTWIQDDPDVAYRMAAAIGKHLRSGLTAEHIEALGKVLEAIYAFVDTWYEGDQVSLDLDNEAVLQERLRQCFGHRGLEVDEGSKVGGGEYDLFVSEAILVENKFHRETSTPSEAVPAAGMQGRRYAIALNSQVVIVMIAYQPLPGRFPAKTQSLTIHPISAGDRNRVEMRFSLPYAAVKPSRERVDERAR